MSMTVSQARATLTSVLDRVEAGEEVTLTRHGSEVAVLVRPDVLRRRRRTPAQSSADALAYVLAQARQTPKKDLPGLTTEQADELVAEIRSGRDR